MTPTQSLAATIALLAASNIFMTFAWYGHLKHLGSTPLYLAILASWGIAFFEYIFQVPANRIGFASGVSLAQLKIVQEVITLVVFVPFAMLYMGQSLKWDYLWAALCMTGAVYFISGPDMHLHILGICGTFMGGLAKVAVERGHTVTGCDAQVYPPMSDQLRALGIELHEGYDAEQLDHVKADLYVIGNAMTRGKPVIEAILDRGLPYVSGPQWLAENVLPGKWVLAVAGTHGKSTTSSMLAWLLEANGLAPGFLIGGIARNFGESARLGETPFFVIEADEYDTAFFDKRSKFVWYQPRTAVLGNLEYDHADIFPDLAAIETQFHHLVRIVPSQGLLVVNGQDAALERVLARGSYTPVERFGAGQAWSVGTIHPDDSFDVLLDGEKQGTVRWALMGEHNRMNALAALAAARHVGVLPKAAIESLARFEGVKRRMEIRGEVQGVTVYDDFAHHPTAFDTTIAGLRTRVGDARIVAVFEPRSNTMKLGRMQERLAKSLDGADLVHCYAHALGWDPEQALAPLGTRAAVHRDLDALVEELARVLRPGDHVLVMSNGGFGGIHEKLLARLARRSALSGTQP